MATRRRPAPSTVTGRLRCPGCNRRFAGQPDRPTTTIRGTEPTPARPGYRAGRADGRVEVDIRWHVDCLASERELGARVVAREIAGRRAAVEALAQEAGMDVAATLAEFDRRNAPTP